MFCALVLGSCGEAAAQASAAGSAAASSAAASGTASGMSAAGMGMGGNGMNLGMGMGMGVYAVRVCIESIGDVEPDRRSGSGNAGVAGYQGWRPGQ